MQSDISSLDLLLEKIDRLKSEVDGLRPLSAEQEGRVMQKFRLDWNYHSNAIEGNSLTYGETIVFLMEGLTAKGKPFKDHLDIKGHNEGIDFLMDLLKKDSPLLEKTIRELHQMILVEPYFTPAQTSGGVRVEKKVTLGAYKKMPNHVKTPTGAIHYYATPEETPAKMGELMEWLHENQRKKELHPVVIAAVFHHRFVAIHPFDDGNGRMSRLLMNFILMQDAYPPVVIKQEDRNAYYAALSQADTGNNEPFVEFIGERLIHSLEIYLRGARGESIEEASDWEKQVALLKKVVAGQKPDALNRQIDRKKQLARWLEINIPIIRETFASRFEPFDSFFAKTERGGYVRYRKSEVNVPLYDPGIKWLDIATGIIDGLYAPEIIVSYYCLGFIYGDIRFESPSIVFKIDGNSVEVGDKKWPVASLLPITAQELAPIDELAKTFYQQIESVTNQ